MDTDSTVPDRKDEKIFSCFQYYKEFEKQRSFNLRGGLYRQYTVECDSINLLRFPHI